MPHSTGPSQTLERFAIRPVAVIAVIQVMLHLVTNGRYGMFRDEFYYLACAENLAWGYVDHPPFSLAVLRGWVEIFGDTVPAVRVLPAVCGAIVIYSGAAIARELRGGMFAQGFTALCIAIAPIFLIQSGFYSMNAFEMLTWTLPLWLILRALRRDDTSIRTWLPIGVICGLALLNKVSAGVMLGALGVGLLCGPNRRLLSRPAVWVAVVVAGAIFAPHVAWQVANEWPTREFVANASRYKIAELSFPTYVSEVVLMLFPGNALVWGSGLLGLLVFPQLRRFRWVGVSFLAAFVVFALLGGKPYYVSFAFLPLLAAGAVQLEAWLKGHLSWLKAVLVSLQLVTGLLLLPASVPVLSPGNLAKFMTTMRLAPAPAENSEVGELPQYYADRFGWYELAVAVRDVYESLSYDEQQQTTILCRNYGEAASIAYFGRQWGLPRTISQHNNYYLWGPGDVGDVFIVMGYDESSLSESFVTHEVAAVVRAQYAMPGQFPLTIYVARRLRAPVQELWPLGRLFI